MASMAQPRAREVGAMTARVHWAYAAVAKRLS